MNVVGLRQLPSIDLAPDLVRDAATRLRRGSAEVAEGAESAVRHWASLPGVFCISSRIDDSMTPVVSASDELQLSCLIVAAALEQAAEDVVVLKAELQQLYSGIVLFHEQLNAASVQAGMTVGLLGMVPIADLALLPQADALILENAILQRRVTQVSARWAEVAATTASAIRRAHTGEAESLRLPYADVDPTVFEAHPENDASVYDLLTQFAAGTGLRHQSFHDGDPLLVELQRDDNLVNARKRLAEAIGAGGLTLGSPIPFDYSVSSQGIEGPIRDAKSLASDGKSGGNLADALLGSYGMTATPTRKNPDGSYEVRFVATNTTTLASGTRAPKIGYTDQWKKLVADPETRATQTGPTSPTSQTFTWTETIWPPH